MNSQAFLVLAEGFLSFFSPCVLPILPVYMAYLSQDAQKKEQTGWKKRLHVFGFTLAFVLGISTVFFLAAVSAKGLSGWLTQNRLLISLLGGLLICFFGLVQLGWVQIPMLMREFRVTSKPYSKEAGSLIQAYIMGFLFSFAWTPCIGPMLSSVLVAAAASSSSTMLIFCYAAGFVIPFLIVGLFTEEVLGWLQKKRDLLPKAAKLGGILLIVMGLWMSLPAMQEISQVLKTGGPSGGSSAVGDGPAATPSSEPQTDENGREIIPAYDFTLTDQYGNPHTLSEYKGKVVMLQFFATWCGYCKAELPSVQELYEELPEDLVILIVNQPGGRETTKEGVIQWLDDNGYTFPTVFDEEGTVNRNYGITGLPTTYLINKEGNVYGYMPGAMDKETMLKIIEMARNNESY